jgi:uncharacterized protein (TIGR00255 family)
VLGEAVPLVRALRERVLKSVRRGKASVFVSWRPARHDGSGPAFSEERLRAIVQQWDDISARLRLPRLTAEAIAALPGVLAEDDKAESLPEEAREAIGRAVDGALAALAEVRLAEGGRLAADLRERLDAVEGLAGRIEEGAASVAEATKEKLRKRWENYAAEARAELDPGRVEMELLAMADRGDITEELVRLRAHLAAFRELIDSPSDEPVGKRFDFLLQEFGREANTIGSKSRGAPVAPLALELKHELEKMREQVQNIA